MMEVRQSKSGRWWIIGVPDSVRRVGPYDRKADAQDDMLGLKRFFKQHNPKQGKLF